MLHDYTHTWHRALTSLWSGEGQAMASLDHNRIVSLDTLETKAAKRQGAVCSLGRRVPE